MSDLEPMDEYEFNNARIWIHVADVPLEHLQELEALGGEVHPVGPGEGDEDCGWGLQVDDDAHIERLLVRIREWKYPHALEEWTMWPRGTTDLLGFIHGPADLGHG